MKKFLEHRKEYCEFLQAQSILREVIEDYLVIFQKTQPHSPSYSGVKVNGKNAVEEYVIDIERENIKQRAEDAERALALKKHLVDLKEEELRKSLDIYDILYCAKWIDNKRTRDVIRELDLMGCEYSSSHLYDVLRRIKREIER